MDFGAFAVDLYSDQLMKAFIDFLGNVHGAPLVKPVIQAPPNLESTQGHPQAVLIMSPDNDTSTPNGSQSHVNLENLISPASGNHVSTKQILTLSNIFSILTMYRAVTGTYL
jgi:hypothetical protein